ncbi:MAG: hypothetical protein K2O95_04395 [Clostridia bacterium]|nr:hypothetical protein [Clostridia bacterium]
MTAFGALTKQIIKNTLIPNFENAKEKKKYIGILVALGIGFGIPYIMILVGAYGMLSIAVTEGYMAEMLSSVFLASQLLTIFFSLFVYINIMYYSKDNEFLFTLPITTVGIFWAKMIAIVLYELILSALTIIPISVVVIIAMANSAVGINIGMIILIIPATVLLPLMAILVIALFSYPIMKIINFFKKRPILGAVFVIILVAAFYIAIYLPIMLNSNAMPSTPDLEGGAVDIKGNTDISAIYKEMLPSLSVVGKYSFHTYFLAKAMTSTSALAGFGNAMAFIGIVLGLAAIGSLLAVWQYKKLASGALESGGNAKTSSKTKEVKQLDVKKALYRKDLFSVLKNNTLLIQAGMMCILPPILIFFVCQMQSGIEGMGAVIGISVAELISKLMLSSNTASVLAFSRDGEGVLMYKTMPVNAKDIVEAKMKTGLTFAIVTTALSVIALAFVSGMNVLFVLGFLASSLLYSYANNRFCIYRDLKKPNIHWKNIQEIVKNNFSSVIPLFLAFIPGLITMAATITIGALLPDLNQYLMALIYIAITLAVGGLYLLITKAVYNYSEEELLQRIE